MSVTFEEVRTEVQEEIDSEVLCRVKKGIALLERKFGVDWYMGINLNTLKLWHSAHCVLGQLYGDYWRGREAVGLLSSEESEEYGFTVRGVGPEAFEELQATWLKVLTPLVGVS